MADGRAPELGHNLREWFLRAGALRAARVSLPEPEALAARAYEQARLLREVARQVAAPVDELPSGGSRPALQLMIQRDLVYWALLARRRDARYPPPELPALWRQLPGDDLLRAAGNSENLAAVERALFELPLAATLDAPAEDAARVVAFGEALFRELEAPRRRAGRVVAQRWSRLAIIPTLIVAVVIVVRTLALGPNLAAKAPFRTSSSWAGCEADEACSALLVHTAGEDNPWVEFDLGAPKRVRRIDVRNRVDCCQDQAVPLVAEVGNDRQHWKQVGRREEIFSTWTAKFPPATVRYVRLRIARPAFLHLADVAIH